MGVIFGQSFLSLLHYLTRVFNHWYPLNQMILGSLRKPNMANRGINIGSSIGLFVIVCMTSKAKCDVNITCLEAKFYKVSKAINIICARATLCCGTIFRFPQTILSVTSASWLNATGSRRDWLKMPIFIQEWLHGHQIQVIRSLTVQWHDIRKYFLTFFPDCVKASCYENQTSEITCSGDRWSFQCK